MFFFVCVRKFSCIQPCGSRSLDPRSTVLVFKFQLRCCPVLSTYGFVFVSPYLSVNSESSSASFVPNDIEFHFKCKRISLVPDRFLLELRLLNSLSASVTFATIALAVPACDTNFNSRNHCVVFDSCICARSFFNCGSCMSCKIITTNSKSLERSYQQRHSSRVQLQPSFSPMQFEFVLLKFDLPNVS